MDPASLLFIQPDDASSAVPFDPALFESVRQGFLDNISDINRPDIETPRVVDAPAPLHGLKSPVESISVEKRPRTAYSEDGEVGGSCPQFIGVADDRTAIWDNGLDLRVLEMERPMVFDAIRSGHDGIELLSGPKIAGSTQEKWQRGFIAWNKRSVFGSLSHPLGSTQPERESQVETREPVDIALRLPPLAKRPRDILDDYLSSETASQPPLLVKKGRTSSDSALANTPQLAHLSWEACSTLESKPQPQIPIISPYMTESGTCVFEAFYNRHMDYPFKFIPKPEGPKPSVVAQSDLVKMSPTVKPANFIDDNLARIVLEAGKELQIIKEFYPLHPLLTDNQRNKAEVGVQWLFQSQYTSQLRRVCIQTSKHIKNALAAKLTNTRCASRSANPRMQDDGEVVTSLAFLEDTRRMAIDMFENRFNGAMPCYMGLAALEPQSTVNSSLLEFLSLAPNTYRTQEPGLTLACPEMVELLLEPFASPPENSVKGGGALKLLGTMGFLSFITTQSLQYAIHSRALLIRISVLSLYFHDLNLWGHLETMGRFLLMRDGAFVDKLGEALFDERTGLLPKHSAMAATAISDLNSRVPIASYVLGQQERAAAMMSWPPKGGELEMTLRAVLLESSQESRPTVGGRQTEAWPPKRTGVDSMELDCITDPRQSVPEETREEALNLQTCNMRSLTAQELEGSLAFAIKKYDETNKICRNVNALEALDFLYLDYKAPRPLRLLVFTPAALEKYTRLFTFQLQLVRVGAVMKHVYSQLLARERCLQLKTTTRKRSRVEDVAQSIAPHTIEHLLAREMSILHRYRFEAQQVFSGLQAYISDSIGTAWKIFMDRI
ncbi:hypothetical protein BG004_005129, partial [Podila humilis]